MGIGYMESKNKAVHFILMGGTIDSFYDGTVDTVKPLKQSILPEYIRGVKPNFKTKFTQVAMKDSRDLTLNDLKKMKAAIEKSPFQKIIITHGTYSMPDSARYLQSKIKRKDQTIVFTGSLVPITGNVYSDAPFNLGYSVAKAQELPAGIFVSFNGSIFSPDEVAKQIGKGKYYSIFNQK